MSDRVEINQKAVTTKEIAGLAIKTIPAGTEFTITWFDESGLRGNSMCKGLGVTQVWNTEFELISE
jgi:hypothetical protein